MDKRKKGYKPKGNNRNGGKANGRPVNRRKVDVEEARYEDTKHDYNDWSWYAKNQQMLQDAASYSYNNPLGSVLPLDDLVDLQGFSSNYTRRAVPGVMVLNYVPGIGISTDSTSPANLAAQNIYSYVRYMNSGAKNYDMADLMLYLMAMDSIYILWNKIKRAYGYARTYSQRNKYMPTAYAFAEFIDFDDLVDNLSDYRLRINTLAARISSFCVPAVMPLFVRHSWLVSNIYADSDVSKAQQYMFAPAVVYQYDETGSSNGGQLVPIQLGDQTYTVGQLCTKLETMLEKIGYSEDIGVMSGDILKAYGQDKLFKISPVDPDYQVLPVYNEEVLNQIHNARIVGTSFSNYKNNSNYITQDPNKGFLIYNPAFSNGSSINTAEKVMVNMPWESITPENTMVGTRLTVTLKGTSTQVTFSALGSEYIETAYIVYFQESTGNTSVLQRLWVPNSMIVQSLNVTTLLVPVLLSNFDWHPLLPIGVKTGTAPNEVNNIQGMIGDVSNYTILDGENLAKMNLTALMSEFNVPQLGSF